MQDEQMVKEIMQGYKEDIDKAITFLKSEYAVVKAGRANPHILDKVMVDYYGRDGSMTPLNQMGNINIPEARMLTISLWDLNAMGAVRKALQMADLGLTPSDDGRIIRLVFPALTEERRREIVKQVKKICEDAKISLRNARRDCLDIYKSMKNDKQLSEDEYAVLEKDVQKVLDNANATCDEICANKEKEVMEV